jgi:hypothetical protein
MIKYDMASQLLDVICGRWWIRPYQMFDGFIWFLVGGFKHCLFSISYMGCHPSHWRTPSFFRGIGIPPTSYVLWPTIKHYQPLLTTINGIIDAIPSLNLNPILTSQTLGRDHRHPFTHPEAGGGGPLQIALPRDGVAELLGYHWAGHFLEQLDKKKVHIPNMTWEILVLLPI